MLEFRPYQLDILNKIAQSLNNGYRRILIVLPTGGGKTIIMGGLLNYLKVHYGRSDTLVAVPFVQLEKQTREKLNEMGSTPTVETFHKAMNQGPREFQTLIFDEAHHIMAESWQFIPQIIHSDLIVGFTATPYRADECPLLEINGGLFDDLIVGPSTEELTAMGWLADLDYYCYPVIEVIKTSPIILLGDEVGTMEHKFFEPENKEAEIIPEYTTNFNGMSGIVFCETVGHAADMARRFDAVGINSGYVSCYNKKSITNKTFKDFKDNKITILAAVNMASEGLDIPHIKLCIMARKVVGSLNLFLQQIGRTVRPYQNERAKVLDAVGNVYTFGTPQQAAEKEIK